MLCFFLFVRSSYSRSFVCFSCRKRLCHALHNIACPHSYMGALFAGFVCRQSYAALDMTICDIAMECMLPLRLFTCKYTHGENREREKKQYLLKIYSRKFLCGQTVHRALPSFPSFCSSLSPLHFHVLSPIPVRCGFSKLHTLTQSTSKKKEEKKKRKFWWLADFVCTHRAHWHHMDICTYFSIFTVPPFFLSILSMFALFPHALEIYFTSDMHMQWRIS